LQASAGEVRGGERVNSSWYGGGGGGECGVGWELRAAVAP
jgi:hypothetical protein